MPISLQNRQRAIRVDLPWLRRFAALALAPAADCSDDGRFALRALEEIEVTLVSDRTIARIHQEFMSMPDATDVITFEHGELIISAETARRRAPEFGLRLEEEIALYTVHGLLHLNGFEDADPKDASRMRAAQSRIWKSCLAQLPSPVSP